MNINQFISECVDQAGYKFDDSRVSRPALVHWAGKSIVNFFTETELCKDESIGILLAGNSLPMISVFYDESVPASDITVQSLVSKVELVKETFSAAGGTGFDMIAPFWVLTFSGGTGEIGTWNVFGGKLVNPSGILTFGGEGTVVDGVAMTNDAIGYPFVPISAFIAENEIEAEFEAIWNIDPAEGIYGNTGQIIGYGKKLGASVFAGQPNGNFIVSKEGIGIVHLHVVDEFFNSSFQVQIKTKSLSESNTTTHVVVANASGKERIKLKYKGDSKYEVYRFDFSESRYEKVYEFIDTLFGNPNENIFIQAQKGVFYTSTLPGIHYANIKTYMDNIIFSTTETFTDLTLQSALEKMENLSDMQDLMESVYSIKNFKIYKVERVEYNGSYVNPATQEELDQFVDMWRDVPPEDQPTHWWSTGEKIHFYPRTKKNGIVRIRYVAIPKPDALINDTDSLDALPYFNEGFQLRVVPRVVWLIKTRLRQDDALTYKQEYEDNVAKTKLEIADREPARMYTIRPANVGVRNVADRRPR